MAEIVVVVAGVVVRLNLQKHPKVVGVVVVAEDAVAKI